MRSVALYLPSAVAIALLLTGCTGVPLSPSWSRTGSERLASNAQSPHAPSRRADARRTSARSRDADNKMPDESQTNSGRDAGQNSSNKVSMRRLPAVTPDDAPRKNPSASAALAKLKSRSDVDLAAHAEMEKLLSDSPSGADVKLVKTETAVERSSDPDQQRAALKDEPQSSKLEIKVQPKTTPATNSAESADQQPQEKSNSQSDKAGASSPSKDQQPFAKTQSSQEDGASAAPEPRSASPASPKLLARAPTHDEAKPMPASDSGEADSAPGKWQLRLEQAIAALEEDLESEIEANGTSESPGGAPPLDSQLTREQLRREIILRMLHLLAGREEDALAPLEGLEAQEQEYWKHQLHGLSVHLDKQSTPVDDHRRRLALRSLRDALHHLAAASSLDVRNLAFCTQVDSYGRYKAFDKYEFRPSQEALLYVEIDNFAVDQTTQGYETELQASYQIFTLDGRRIAERFWPAEKEVCRNRRRDYFVPFRLYMPQRIYPGKYTLVLTVEDLKANKFGQASIDFTVVQ